MTSIRDVVIAYHRLQGKMNVSSGPAVCRGKFMGYSRIGRVAVHDELRDSRFPQLDIQLKRHRYL